jgi:YfiH family protein
MNAIRIEIDQPAIFPLPVLAGVTRKNTDIFPPHGLSLHRAGILADDEVAVHRRTFAETIGVAPEQLQFQRQVHGTVVSVIRDVAPAEESDGMITDRNDIILCVSIADCAAVLLYDPEHDVVAGLHSGWRGTVGNIVAVGIEKMSSEFGSRPEQLLAYISACASEHRYVVREDVAGQFPEAYKKQVSEVEWVLDIRGYIRQQLLNKGVLATHIECSEACTIGNEAYHSYRRDRDNSGRMTAFIGLRYEEI